MDQNEGKFVGGGAVAEDFVCDGVRCGGGNLEE
jgi:hypothetical protein